MFKLFHMFRKLSSVSMCNPNIYTENVIVYNKRQKYFEDRIKTYFVNNKNEHICHDFTKNICKICKGHGIIFNTTSVIDFNYYRLCENCKGTGLV